MVSAPLVNLAQAAARLDRLGAGCCRAWPPRWPWASSPRRVRATRKKQAVDRPRRRHACCMRRRPDRRRAGACRRPQRPRDAGRRRRRRGRAAVRGGGAPGRRARPQRPLTATMKLARAYNPQLWKAMDDLGVGRLVVQAGRERELANLYRGNDDARRLSDEEFAEVLAFTKNGVRHGGAACCRSATAGCQGQEGMTMTTTTNTSPRKGASASASGRPAEDVGEPRHRPERTARYAQDRIRRSQGSGAPRFASKSPPCRWTRAARISTPFSRPVAARIEGCANWCAGRSRSSRPRSAVAGGDPVDAPRRPARRAWCNSTNSASARSARAGRCRSPAFASASCARSSRRRCACSAYAAGGDVGAIRDRPHRLDRALFTTRPADCGGRSCAPGTRGGELVQCSRRTGCSQCAPRHPYLHGGAFVVETPRPHGASAGGCPGCRAGCRAWRTRSQLRPTMPWRPAIAGYWQVDTPDARSSSLATRRAATLRSACCSASCMKGCRCRVAPWRCRR